MEAPQKLGELLIAAGQITEQERAQALEFQGLQGGRMGEILVRLGALSEEALYQALAAQSALPMVTAADLDASQVQDGLSVWPQSRDWWQRHHAVPWVSNDGLRHVAAVDPLLLDLRETLESLAPDAVVQWHFIQPVEVERWRVALDSQSGGQLGSVDVRTLRELAEDAPIITFVNNVFAQAVEARASDVHLEPGEHEFEVRLRVDGVLQTRMSMPMSRYAAVASRVKLISQLDIAERRLPQDGRTSIRVAGADMDVRVSSIPAVHGESLVMRLLPKARADLNLERLGMESDHLSMFKDWLHLPNGLVLVTGPTGSGKSTTLYGALSAVNDFSRKIITVEDPVEFRLPHIVQIQTQAEIGYTFARALRSILRHDPDIIMVGEIRDRETAEIAVQSALTGHLVLATLHTNDALSAVTRLVDMGVEPYLVAASLKAVMAQRLVRRLCQSCAQPIAPSAASASRWARVVSRLSPQVVAAPARWRGPVGCPDCQQTGYRGRVGIYELVTMSDAMQASIAAQAPQTEVQALADEAGRRSLVDDGLIKARLGLTTFEEVLRAAGMTAID